MNDGPSEYGFSAKYTSDLGGFVMIEVDKNGGSEGEGDSADVTYAIAPAHGKHSNGRVEGAAAYIQYNGFYDSYNGTEWDSDATLVKPVDVMVVQYHAA